MARATLSHPLATPCTADGPSLWKLASQVEARLQMCTRRLFDAGIDVVPDGNDSYEMFCFAVPTS